MTAVGDIITARATHSRTALKSRLMLFVLVVLLLLLVAVSLLSGRVWLRPGEVLSGLFSANSDLASLIVTELRLPRTVLAVAIGATLGLCGAVLQGLTRNPLAEPGLLGVSAGASLGAVIAIYF